MSREIKFRAKYGTGIHKVVVIDWDFEVCSVERTVGEHTINEHYGLDEVELMQFTGLKDKNGKEIYEGDIVRVKGYYVYFRDTERGPEPHETPINEIVEVKINPWGCGLCIGDTEPEYEIVGNIHENPDLLEGGE